MGFYAVLKKLAITLKNLLYIWVKGVIKKKNRLSTVLHLLLLVLALFCYMRSLEECPFDDEFLCSEWLLRYNVGEGKVTVPLFVCCLIIFYLFLAVFCFKLVNRGFIIILCGAAIHMWFADAAVTFKKHGGANRIFLLLPIMIAMTVSILTRSCLKICKKMSRLVMLNLFCLCVCWVVFLNRNRAAERNFLQFPGGVITKNDSFDCAFSIPSYHWFPIFQHPVSLATFSVCGSSDVSWVPKQLLSSKFLAFPNAATLPANVVTTHTFLDNAKLQAYVTSNLQPINNSQQAELHEMVIQLDKSPHLVIKVCRNETLSKILRAKRVGYQKTRNSVLVIFFDSVSRAGLKSRMPAFFDKLGSWKTKGIMQGIAFSHFHALQPFTSPNRLALHNGKTIEEARSEKLWLAENESFSGGIFETASKQGFCTGFAHTDCDADDQLPSDYTPAAPEKHDHRLIFCSPSFIEAGIKQYNLFKGPSSVFQRCLFNKPVHQHALNYVTSFWQEYYDSLKFFKLSLMEGHEITSDLLRLADEDLVRFLNDFEKKEHTKNTTIILLSDHGLHIHYLLRPLALSDNEMYTPFLHILVPPHVNLKQDVVQHNSKALVTMFDVHTTLMKLFGDSTANVRGFDLLNSFVPSNRSCADAGIQHADCRCINNTETRSF